MFLEKASHKENIMQPDCFITRAFACSTLPFERPPKGNAPLQLLQNLPQSIERTFFVFKACEETKTPMEATSRETIANYDHLSESLLRKDISKAEKELLACVRASKAKVASTGTDRQQ